LQLRTAETLERERRAEIKKAQQELRRRTRRRLAALRQVGSDRELGAQNRAQAVAIALRGRITEVDTPLSA
jgi:hypothetical protein